ncbi:MAG: 4Fe-4S dicluster domain-containing protein [Candidatus Hydrogenedentes bacterium]|nr:4Fe-4S dicluster domain-containing protein [Candidatus Hydrogenedentota bacterium]
MNIKPGTEKNGQGRNYWRSLEHVQDNGDPREFISENPSELPEGFSRRGMLKLMAASVSLAGLTACRRPVETIVPYVIPPEQVLPGVPRYYATTMPLGLSAYGLIVESHEGRPIKIEGNPRHPSTLGASSAMIQAAILGLYDPDRSQSVLHDGEEKTWADFVEAWQSLEQTHLEDQGAGLALLSESFSSPTLARLKSAFLLRFPRARWVTYEPASAENVFDGLELAAGQAYQPAYRFGRANIILSLDADFLLSDTENVAHARGFAEGRSIQSGNDSMNRLYVAESAFSLTGANADHRLRIQSGRIGGLLVAVAAELERLGLDITIPGMATRDSGLPDVDPKWIQAVAGDLLANRGEGIIVAGDRQAPAVHAAVFALNKALGNVDSTITYHDLKDASISRRKELIDLVAAMEGGAVSTLIVLGGNPVYNAPIDLRFAEHLSKLNTIIRLGPYMDETAGLAHWHVPETHFLEAWGDARAVGGTASVIQPLILPLFGAHSAVEMLGVLTGGGDLPGYDHVRATWKETLGQGDFEKRWRRVLHDGLLQGSELPPVDPALRPSALSDAVMALQEPAGAGARDAAEAKGSLEIVFHRSPAVFDGRFANNGWLQELPDAITKITWDNVAVMSPKTAREQGLRNEDVARLRYRDRVVELPVWVVPGHADGTVSVTLGYGRRSAGRVGNDVGVDLYAIRTAEAPGFDNGLSLEPTGKTYPLAGTQDHGSMEGRPIVREASLEHYKEHPDFAQHAEAHFGPGEKLFKDPVNWGEGNQWGMTIDLSTCTGCNACMVACQSENNVPIVGKAQVEEGREMHWIRVDRYFTSPASEEGTESAHGSEGSLIRDPIPEEPQMVFQPLPCQHCETAPCEQVCPTAATLHDREGLNVMVYNRCIGTRYCLNNCPYKVRRFNYFNLTKHLPEVMKLAQNPDVTVRSRGVMEKCTFCLQRINAGKKKAKREGRQVRDADVQPACQQTCPVGAIRFGNINDPASLVTQNKQNERNYDLLGEINTRPRVSYLAKVRNPHPDLAGA